MCGKVQYSENRMHSFTYKAAYALQQGSQPAIEAVLMVLLHVDLIALLSLQCSSKELGNPSSPTYLKTVIILPGISFRFY